MSRLEPQEHLDDSDVERGMHLFLLDGVTTQVMGAFTGGALLVAYALLLGASNKMIGLIAAIGPLSQLLQIPAILLVESTRRRKQLVILCSFFGRLAWLAVAAIPFTGTATPLALLVAALLLYYGTNSVASAAYNSWKRDLVPEQVLGRYLARRLTWATGAAAVVTLGCGFAVDRFGSSFESPLTVYVPLFVAGAVTGLLGVLFLARTPEPRMAAPDGRSLWALLLAPFRDSNFRRLVFFLATWNLAVNLAAPFFTVYMLVRLELRMSWILALTVLSQVANLAFFPIWGRLSDRLGHRPTLGLSGSLFIGSIALWPLTTLPERYALTVPLIIAIHLLAGMSTAGVTLGTASITLKLAPRGKATAFLAANTLMSGLAATIGPLLGGVLGDLFEQRRLTLEMRWSSPDTIERLLRGLDLSGLDFVFVLAVLIGLYALHRLLAVQEPGAKEEGLPMAELYGELRRTVSHVSTVAGLRRLTSFPYDLLRDVLDSRDPRRPGDDDRGSTDP